VWICCAGIFRCLSRRFCEKKSRYLVKWSMLQIHDDGEGVLPDDIKFCGLLNFTSKICNPSDLYTLNIKTYGFRGQALAAISSFCILEIVSCSRQRPAQTSRTIVRNGQPQPPLTSIVSKQRPGTSVYCRDLFYNRPVARKVKQELNSDCVLHLFPFFLDFWFNFA
jgi:DNA mismatch repair protein MutL